MIVYSLSVHLYQVNCGDYLCSRQIFTDKGNTCNLTKYIVYQIKIPTFNRAVIRCQIWVLEDGLLLLFQVFRLLYIGQ